MHVYIAVTSIVFKWMAQSVKVKQIFESFQVGEIRMR